MLAISPLAFTRHIIRLMKTNPIGISRPASERLISAVHVSAMHFLPSDLCFSKLNGAQGSEHKRTAVNNRTQQETVRKNGDICGQMMLGLSKAHTPLLLQVECQIGVRIILHLRPTITHEPKANNILATSSTTKSPIFSFFTHLNLFRLLYLMSKSSGRILSIIAQ